MSVQKSKFYLTTPIYYVNARPHIGHAYTTIVADVLARRHRLLGDDTFFLTGTDEHGQKIARSAAAAGIPPQQFADQVSKSFSDLWARMGIARDSADSGYPTDPLFHYDFIRTTDARHQRGVQKLFSELYARGFIYLASYTGQYCVSDEAFVDVAPGEPCPDCGRPTETLTEENFFFKLSEFQLPLLDLIESNTLLITPESRRNEVLSFLRGNVSTATEPGGPFMAQSHRDMGGVRDPILARTALGTPYVPGVLKDLSISRSSFTWGIPVPEPAASAAKQKHVIYVWLDALANYMTALGYGSDDETLFRKFWPADLHLVGKEIIRFHCVYWPAFLLAAGLPLPKAITAHGWLLFDNSKMSKSKGNIVRTETILDAFGDHVYAKQFPDSTKAERDLFASDVLRYFLLREIPFGQDGSFSFDALITRYNAELANGYGNLVSRTLSMIGKYFDGVVPNAPPDPELRSMAMGWVGVVAGIPAVHGYSFTRVLEELARQATSIDETLTKRAPWKIAARAHQGDDCANVELVEVLYTAAEFIRVLTAVLYPFLPATTAKVWQQLGLGDIELAARNGELKNLQWGGLKPGTKLGPLAPIFPRAPKELADIMSEIEEKNALAAQSSQPATEQPTQHRLEPNLPAGAPALVPPTEETVHPQITIDDFAKIDLRVAQILVAERIPKADKLLRLEVDLGYEKRQILSGIAEFYTPGELIGRRIVVITNLAPRKMRGLESHGMLLAASADPGPDGDPGKPILATMAEDIALGSRLK